MSTSKKYSSVELKRESELSTLFLVLRNDYESETDEDKLQGIETRIREVFEPLYKLRVQLGIYSSNTHHKEGILQGILEYIRSKKNNIEESI